MTKNMGNADRLVRVLIAVLIGIAYFTGMISGTVAIVAAVIAVVFLATSVISFCPLYRLVGMNTCARR